MPKVKLDGKEYDIPSSGEVPLGILEQLKKVETKISECQNMISVLTKAKRAYISDLKSEIISSKAGLDL